MFPLLVFNSQPIEKQDLDPDGALDIAGKPFATIQGEGPYTGIPSIFVRLAGCNLQCPLCDTDYTSDRRRLSTNLLLEEIATEAREIGGKHPLVVLTGGEPFRQNITPLIDFLLGLGHIVQIETNGTLNIPFANRLELSLVCSPKTGSLHPSMGNFAVTYKYVIEAGKTDPNDGLPTSVLGMKCKVARPPKNFKGNVYVQPQDDGDLEKNGANIKETVRVAMKYGYRLSLQTHKILDLP